MTPRKKLPARTAPAVAAAPRGLHPSAHRVLLPSIAAVQIAIACLGCGRDRPRADAERSLVTITADPQAKPRPAPPSTPESRAPTSEAAPQLPGMATHGELEEPSLPPAKLVRTPMAPDPVAAPPPAPHPPAVMGTVSMPVRTPPLPPAMPVAPATPGTPGTPVAPSPPTPSP